MTARNRPEQTRAQDGGFVARCNLLGLRERLPIQWPTPVDIPPSPKKRYRSTYQYPGWEHLEEPGCWETLSHYDVLLRLVGFSGLRDVLALRLGWTSAKGQVPFDPISLFLLQGWQIVQDWSRACSGPIKLDTF